MLLHPNPNLNIDSESLRAALQLSATSAMRVSVVGLRAAVLTKQTLTRDPPQTAATHRTASDITLGVSAHSQRGTNSAGKHINSKRLV